MRKAITKNYDQMIKVEQAEQKVMHKQEEQKVLDEQEFPVHLDGNMQRNLNDDQEILNNSNLIKMRPKNRKKLAIDRNGEEIVGTKKNVRPGYRGTRKVKNFKIEGL